MSKNKKSQTDPGNKTPEKGKTTKPSSNRSHQFADANHAESATSTKDSRPKPDDSDTTQACSAWFWAPAGGGADPGLGQVWRMP
jgi:hypothetical protein